MNLIDNSYVALTTKQEEILDLGYAAGLVPGLGVLNVNNFFALPIIGLQRANMLFLHQDMVFLGRQQDVRYGKEALTLFVKLQSVEIQQNDVRFLALGSKTDGLLSNYQIALRFANGDIHDW